MSVEADDVRAMARLARLAIDEAEIPAYAAQLSGILAFVEQMNAIDTSGVAPLAHPLDLPARLRADAVTETDQRDELQAGAPQTAAGLYLVPQVIE
ncbi:MAG: Asp-tRNA(Asn)/Glu-tRNA(Gln) amidotransferase subunit GatC [Gammaproteobacteria bacterium]